MDEVIHEDNSCILYIAFMRLFQEHRADDECRLERKGQQQHSKNRTALVDTGDGTICRSRIP